MSKKLAAVIVLIIVVASIAGCASITNMFNPVQITASKGRPWSSEGSEYRFVNVDITNNGQEDFYPNGGSFTFYRNGEKINEADFTIGDRVSGTTYVGHHIDSVVKPGGKISLDFSFVQYSYPDMLQYNDGKINVNVAI